MSKTKKKMPIVQKKSWYVQCPVPGCRANGVRALRNFCSEHAAKLNEREKAKLRGAQKGNGNGATHAVRTPSEFPMLVTYTDNDGRQMEQYTTTAEALEAYARLTLLGVGEVKLWRLAPEKVKITAAFEQR